MRPANGMSCAAFRLGWLVVPAVWSCVRPPSRVTSPSCCPDQLCEHPQQQLLWLLQHQCPTPLSCLQLLLSTWTTCWGCMLTTPVLPTSRAGARLPPPCQPPPSTTPLRSVWPAVPTGPQPPPPSSSRWCHRYPWGGPRMPVIPCPPCVAMSCAVEATACPALSPRQEALQGTAGNHPQHPIAARLQALAERHAAYRPPAPDSVYSQFSSMSITGAGNGVPCAWWGPAEFKASHSRWQWP